MRLVFIGLFIVIGLQAQSYQEIVEHKLKEMFGEQTTFLYKQITLDHSIKSDAEKVVYQRFFRPTLYSWKFTDSKQNTRYAVLDNVIGKVQPITFLTIFDDNLSIEFVEVLKYRESHGYEVQRRSFLEQFEQKSDESEFQIKNIAGATISVTSMSKGVQKLALIMPFIKDQLNGI